MFPGDVTIPRDLQGADPLVFGESLPDQTERTPLPDPFIPPGDALYTVGNRISYREIALDFFPGRIKKGGRETAPQDWYENFVRGGGLPVVARRGFSKVLKQSGFR